jgi:hypothetical protein
MQSAQSVTLKQRDLPALYQATDIAAKRRQRLFIVSILAEIIFALLGALALVLEEIPDVMQAASSIATINVVGITVVPLSLATAVALLAIAVTLIVRYVFKLDENWRESRFLGEQCATLAWRYAARATPADLGESQDIQTDADRWYLDQIDDLLQQAKLLDLPDVKERDELTPAMSAFRNAPVEQRYTAYLNDRAIDQRDWYDRKARQYNRLRNSWRTVIILIYVVGAGLVLAHATPLRDQVPFGLLTANYWPVVAAAAGGVTAYMAARYYDDLQQTYRYLSERLSGEIAIMRDFTPTPDRERRISEFVDRIETLMDTEHQQWHALSQ